MAGGVSMPGSLTRSVQRTFDAVYFEDFEKATTFEFAYGCMTMLNSTTLYVAPGSGDNILQKYTIMTSSWTSIGEIPSGGRNNLGCGVAKNRFGQTEIIIAGGFQSGASVDIYNLETNEWKSSGK